MAETLTSAKPRYQGWKVTREEYLDLTDDGFKYDVVHGEMRLAPSPSFQHGNIFVRIAAILGQYLEVHKTGSAVGEIDVFLPDGGDVVRPDLSFLLNENLNKVKTHIHGAPDLVCEILSESTRERDLGEKADRYLKCGVKEYWIIDPERKSIQLWLNGTEKWEKKESETLDSQTLPGLRISQTGFWRQ